MAIDQTPSTSPPDSKGLPAIDNEFPTYRAISPTAVLSMVFGLGSVFCFADLWFLLMTAASVALGLHSLKKIRELPEVLTGANLARVGIGIALLFGLTSITRAVTENLTINIDAGRFARKYVEVLKNEPVSMALWYQQPPAYRNEKKNPDELVEELKKSKSQMGGDAYSTAAKPIQDIKERLDGGKGGDMVYDQIETKAIDGLTTYANALIKLDLKPAPGHAETEQYALFRLTKGQDDWVVKEVVFPYKPQSTVATVEHKADDGHGH